MLSVDSAAAFLIERGLIDHTGITENNLTIRSAVRRNRNLKVDGTGGTGFLIKEPVEAAEEGHRDTLWCEAAFHRLCRDEPALATIMRFVPGLVADDLESTVLIFELVSDAETLAMYMEAADAGGLIVDAARALGSTLATVHRIFSLTTWEHDARLAWLPRSIPWVMRLHKPWPSLLANLNPATYQLLRVLQTDEGLWEQFDALQRRWQPGTVNHGDIRFDNVLVRRPREANETTPVELWIVDWEMVGIGDPAWDLAGALQEFLAFWVSSMPLTDGLTADEMVAEARVPLTALRSALRALWSGYRGQAGLEADEANDLLARAVGFSAARLVQSAFELLSGADRLAGPAVVMLQISANLLADPERGQIELYGIPSS
jgi:aminoglycoside phosphotransferase (APT) family kinase protein